MFRISASVTSNTSDSTQTRTPRSSRQTTSTEPVFSTAYVLHRQKHGREILVRPSQRRGRNKIRHSHSKVVQRTVADSGHDAVLVLEGAGVVSAMLLAANRDTQPLEGFHRRRGVEHVREAMKLLPKKKKAQDKNIFSKSVEEKKNKKKKRPHVRDLE